MHGHNIASSFERLKPKFYAKNKSKFLLKKSAHLNRIMRENQAVALNIIKNGPIYEKPQVIQKKNEKSGFYNTGILNK